MDTGDFNVYAEMSGKTISDRYILHEIIGTGATGVVYRGLQTAMNREVAIKMMPAHNPCQISPRRKILV